MAAPSAKSRVRPSTVLMLLALVVTATGVIVLNKVKDKRAYDIFIREKDRMIKLLDLRYEREKVYSQELQSKVESMRAKIESLKDQKAKLNSKIIELHSLTTSLKKKCKTKQKKVTSLKEEKGPSRRWRAQLVEMKEKLKQKEDGIHELKRRDENPSALQSGVSLGDHNSPTNITDLTNVDMKNTTEEADTTRQHSQKKEDDNAEIRQDETIFIVTNFDARENPQSATEEQPKIPKSNAPGIQFGGTDGRADTPHTGNTIQGHREDLDDTDINHSKQKNDVEDED